MDILAKYYFSFLIYAFFGYIAEVIYVFILTKKITNRGYLFGPLVPIYGFGALLIVLPINEGVEAFKFMYDHFYLMLIYGFIATTVLEYLVSFILEKIFKMRWWDYSDKFLNINGRVCLRNSLLFTALVALVCYLLNPVVLNVCNFIIDIKPLMYSLMISTFILLMVDFIISTSKHIEISKVIKTLNNMLELTKEKAMDAKEKLEEKKNNTLEYIHNTKAYIKLNNIKKKYPTLKVIKNNKIKEGLNEFIEKIKSKFGE